MVRTQLQIDEVTYEALWVKAHNQRKSMSAIVREILKKSLIEPQQQDEQTQETDLKKKYSWIGMGKSGETDISEHQDEYLLRISNKLQTNFN